MMRQMILSKSCRVRYTNWEVCKDGKQSVVDAGTECQVMADLMDGEEEILVRRRSSHVCCEKEGPGENGGIFEKVCAEDLQSHDERHQVFRERLRAT